MLPIVKQFDPLTREQILAIRPGTWGDSELLDVLKYFETERKDRDRAMAVAELILRSPQRTSSQWPKRSNTPAPLRA